MNLYTFTSQLETVRMTTAKADVEWDGNTYTATTLERSTYTQDSVLRKNNIDIKFPYDNLFAIKFIHPTTDNLRVTIATLSGVVFYRGRLIMVDYNTQNEIIFRFEPIIRMSRRTLGERRIYQIHCPYLVYGTNCGASAAIQPFTVLEVHSPRKLVIRYDCGNPQNDRRPMDERFNVLPTSHTDSRGFPQPRYVNIGRLSGGLISPSTAVGTSELKKDEKQWWITKLESADASGQYISVVAYTYQSHNMKVNDRVYCLFGCKLTPSDCRDTHNNIENFGGFPTMKKISPFEGGLKG